VRRINLRISGKLGLVAGIGVVLVCGMLANEWVGNQSIAHSSRLVIINYSNKANAPAAEPAMARARVAIRDVEDAATSERVTTSLAALNAAISEAAREIDAAAKRATRKVMQDHYAETLRFIDTYKTAATDLTEAQKASIRRRASTPWRAASMRCRPGPRRSTHCSRHPALPARQSIAISK
jgi:hypothetical protein